MSEHPHSDHKPPYNTPSSFGVHYPERDIISVFMDRASAEQAAQELRAMGIPHDDVDTASGDQVLEFERQRAKSQGALGRIARLATVLSEDGHYQEELLTAARAGGTFVVVHAERADVVEQARPVLAAHHARIALYYGRGSIEELI